MNSDRIKQSLLKFIRSGQPRIDFYALYEAKVVAQSVDGATLDVDPFDARLPSMQRVPLRNGLPGVVAKFAPGQTVLLGWSAGNPNAPFITAGYSGGETVTQLTIKASQIILGDTGGEPAAKATTLGAWLDAHMHSVTSAPGTTGPPTVLSSTVQIAATNVQVK